MILSAQTIRIRVLTRVSSIHLGIEPFCERTVVHGKSYGLSAAGYDIRIADALILEPGDFRLATTVEHFDIPFDLMGKLADKSSWARQGIAVQNTIFEPGWRGFPTLEVSNHSRETVRIPAGSPIGQMIFQVLDQPTELPYDGKYQDQLQFPTPAIEEDSHG